MISILIVDDEMHAVQGLQCATDWRSMGIDAVYTAYSMKQAQQVFRAHSIDILLSDIEMPRGSGLDLLEWIRSEGFDTENIFLTSHANFTYANQALKLGSIDYLLKPVAKAELELAVKKAAGMTIEKREKQKKEALAGYWSDIEKHHMSQFWLSVVNESIGPDDERIKHQAAQMHVPIRPEDLYLPVLVSVGGDEGQARSVVDDTIRQIGRETVFQAAPPMLLPYDKGQYIIMDAWQGDLQGRRADIAARCKAFSAHCERRARICLTCYIGKYVAAPALSAEVVHLIKARKEWVMEEGGVIDCINEPRHQPVYVKPQVTAWLLNLEQGRGEAAVAAAWAYLDTLVQEKNMSREILTRFFHDFTQELYVVCHKKEIQAHLLLQDEDYEEMYQKAVTSVTNMKCWIQYTADKVQTHIGKVAQGDSVIQVLKRYIEEHLSEELGRDQLAKQVFLNPEYLSRLFRKKAGCSLSDYITGERIKRAKVLLRTSSLPVGEISFQTGYHNWAYFSKIFKKLTGKTPQQYRNQQG